MGTIAKRVALFLVLNIVVVLTLSTVTRLLGLDRMVMRQGFDLQALALWCLVWGMGGSLITLSLSRVIARWQMGVQLIDPGDHTQLAQPHLRFLVTTVERLARQAGLPATPQVGIYDSPEVNAFATGPTRARALVAVSTGLLRQMDENEATGVLAHEISHVANGDMVTMTLLQGVVNAFAMFLARALAWAISQATRRDDDSRGGGAMTWVLQMVLELGFLMLGSLLVAWFSRWREYRADAGAAALNGRDSMVRALRRLQGNVTSGEGAPAASRAVETLQIEGRPARGGLLALFASHPPIAERIARLERAGSPVL